MPCTRLATTLDLEALNNSGTVVAPASTPDSALPVKHGTDVYDELGERFVARYLLPTQITSFLHGSADRHWVTPTPFDPSEAIAALALWDPADPRTHVMILDPREIDVMVGPRIVRFGTGIEYILPNGFPAAALMPVPVLQVT